MIAAIRLRGSMKVRKDIKDTLRMLNLDRVNTLSIIEITPSNIGMIKKAESFVAWGEISEDLRKELD
ncbi:MAG: uL30 family ribosomal protein, partial [Candidatus Aenigmarchaeota archaeon]|nr:uL30 family ribosomal protein [Candidatus Aenigmarchaeota archaeon]MDI6722958.1 uL30 family ribosomal protein [Candidatus Aenigmarchaeota archaeon]